MLTTNQKGAIAETAIVHEATKHGIDVYRPIAEGGRYDMLFDLGSEIVRVQCKWAPRHRDVVVVRCYSTRRNGSGLLRRIYTPGEIDAFAAYCPETAKCYLLPYPTFSGRTQVNLRLGRCRNNQRMGVNWASDFEFAARLRAAFAGP